VSAKTEILEAAHRWGWQVDSDLGWIVSFARTPEVDVRFAKVAELGDWHIRDRVRVHFSQNGRVVDAELQSHKEQSALTGRHLGSIRVTGTGRKEQVLAWLERNAT
jgi:hypothetical protein